MPPRHRGGVPTDAPVPVVFSEGRQWPHLADDRHLKHLELRLLARSGALKPQAIELRLVLAECTDLLSEALESSSIELMCSPDAGLFVSACEGGLQQVFSNLLSNSVEAMASVGGQLRVSATTVGSNVEVIVEDTGPGIPEHLRGKVFEPFYSTKRDRGGTGLGLSISAEIVRRNGGELTIEAPKDGIGARFLVRLRSSSAGD